ncbi:MAG: intradiol ring-cleavage dioxygenase [Flavobacteriaceae bacterium]
MLKSSLLFCLMAVMMNCAGQSEKENASAATKVKGVIGGPFENGEFMFIGMPEKISSVDTSAGWHRSAQKLVVKGTVFKRDGKTPAPDVILYYYHTDDHGLYANHDELDQRVKRHGYLRGWVKSDQKGNYAIYTLRPAPYPNADEPAHIHPAIQDPGVENPYYLDALVFDDDPLLTTAKRKAMENRGGSGVLRPLLDGDVQIAEHNIILGLNIPGHPDKEAFENVSGKNIGEDVVSFTPFHAWGPDKGTRTCPICKYGRYHGLLYFVGNTPNWDHIEKWLVFLEQESAKRKQYLKSYFIYGNEDDYSMTGRTKELEALGKKLGLQHLALTFVPSFHDKSSEVDLNKIDPNIESTILLYRNRNIIDKFIGLEPTESNFRKVTERLDHTTDDLFQLPTLLGHD